MPMLRFPRVFRRFENVEALLASVVESVADAAGVTPRRDFFARSGRATVIGFAPACAACRKPTRSNMANAIRWCAGSNCTRISFAAAILPQASIHATTLMRRALDTFGAEVIVPLHARGRIIGWLFFGHRVTGQRFRLSRSRRT